MKDNGLYVPRIFSEVLNNWLKSKALTSAQPLFNKDKSSMVSLNEWEDCVRQVTVNTRVRAVGFEIGRCIHTSNLGALGYLVANSYDFSELLSMYQLYEKRFYGKSWVEIKFGENEFQLSWDTRHTEFDRIIEQIHSIVLVDFISTVCPDVGSPIRVTVTNAEYGERQYYENAFACSVGFSSESMSLTYSNKMLQSPVNVAGPMLNQYSDEGQVALLKGITGTAPFVCSVQKEILYQLPSGSRIKNVALALAMSSRSLQRHLSKSHCTYSVLLDGLREKRASQLLKDARLNMSEVVFLLGYSEQSAFNHAYKRWAGHSPRKTTMHKI